MVSETVGKIVVVWRGNREARAAATPENNRFHSVFEELARAGVHAKPAVYAEEMADEVRAQLLNADGVLVRFPMAATAARSMRCCVMSHGKGSG